MQASSSAAQTAVGPMVIAAVEQHLAASERIVTDPFAIHMLPRSSARIAEFCRWSPVRRLLTGLSEAAAPGAWGGMLGRKRFLMDQATSFVRTAKAPMVVLGSGLDTKALSLVISEGIEAFEIDQAENVALKREGLRRALTEVPNGFHLISVDFEKADLEQELTRAGFDISRPALYVWEGVTQYLTEDAVRQTMAFLSKAAAGSRLAFTYVLADFLEGSQMHGAEAMHRRLVQGHEVWKFGLDPHDVASFLSPYGWAVRHHVGADEYRRDYFDGTNRRMAIMAIERAIIADKL